MIAAMWPRAALVPVSVGRVDGWGMDDSLAALSGGNLAWRGTFAANAYIRIGGGDFTTSGAWPAAEPTFAR